MSAVAGIARMTWSKLERADGADVSILVWVRAAGRPAAISVRMSMARQPPTSPAMLRTCVPRSSS